MIWLPEGGKEQVLSSNLTDLWSTQLTQIYFCFSALLDPVHIKRAVVSLVTVGFLNMSSRKELRIPTHRWKRRKALVGAMSVFNLLSPGWLSNVMS